MAGTRLHARRSPNHILRHTDGGEAGKKWKTRLMPSHCVYAFALSLTSPHLSSLHSLTCHAFPPTSSSPDHRQLFPPSIFPLLVTSTSRNACITSGELEETACHAYPRLSRDEFKQSRSVILMRREEERRDSQFWKDERTSGSRRERTAVKRQAKRVDVMLEE